MSNAPTPAREQHAEAIEPPQVDAHAFRRGWRIRTRLDALLWAGAIDSGEWQALVAYREHWERVLSAVGGSTGIEHIRSGGSGNATLDRLTAVVDTATRLREVEAATGPMASLLCVWCAVEDRPWTWSSRKLGCTPPTARVWTIAAISRLAAAWSGPGRPPGARPAQWSGDTDTPL